MEELKRCQKCGGEAIFAHIKDFFDESYRKYAVYCLECETKTERYDSKDEAAEAWNRGVENDK